MAGFEVTAEARATALKYLWIVRKPSSDGVQSCGWTSARTSAAGAGR